MPTQPTTIPEALDALIAASHQSRRETLLRAAGRQRNRTRFGYACAGGIVLLALAAIFLAHDNEAAIVISSLVA
jgi:hypothetical protein